MGRGRGWGWRVGRGGVEGGVGWGAKFLFVFDGGVMLYLFFEFSVLCLVLISTISIESPALPFPHKQKTYHQQAGFLNMFLIFGRSMGVLVCFCFEVEVAGFPYMP